MAGESLQEQLKKLGFAEDEPETETRVTTPSPAKGTRPARQRTPQRPIRPTERPPSGDPALAWQWLNDIASPAYVPSARQIQAAAMLSAPFGYLGRILSRPNTDTAVRIVARLDRDFGESAVSLADLLLALKVWCQPGTVVWEYIAQQLAETDVALEFDRLDPAAAMDSKHFRTRYQELRSAFLSDRGIRKAYLGLRETATNRVRAAVEKERKEAIRTQKTARRRELCRRLSELLDSFTSLRADPQVHLPSLSEEDIALVDNWCEYRIQREAERRGCSLSGAAVKMRDRGRKVQRNLAARAGEIAAKSYYSRLGCKVTDVSFQQQLEPGSSDWKTHDLVVDGQPIDVKNSRRSLASATSNIKTYTEHTVTEFKRDRFRSDVSIAGILSPYLQVLDLLDIDETLTGCAPYSERYPDPAIYLGETSAPYIRILEQQFSDLGSAQLDFRRDPSSSRYFIPGWLFDYPEISYALGEDLTSSRQALARDCIPILDELEMPRAQWPHQILAGEFQTESLEVIPGHLHSAIQRLTRHISVADLRALSYSFGFSLRRFAQVATMPPREHSSLPS